MRPHAQFTYQISKGERPQMACELHGIAKSRHGVACRKATLKWRLRRVAARQMERAVATVAPGVPASVRAPSPIYLNV